MPGSFGPHPLHHRRYANNWVRRIGRDWLAASRVIVPLKSLLEGEQIPDVEATSRSDHGLSITVGSQGAGRTRSLALGEGVQQHVLIAGKTGSGKSTLLHSIITGGAALYRPDQLQYYLLDFKKGVEFKVYADNGLPHARVIGIESEREFGRSVLQRLDEELTSRGEQFRQASVQEMSEFRARHPDVDLPRIILVVDEFQELFTRDDALASDCTALLDRLVRQGRSFGIHIILSSQSLAGANSLPRATLGQMAVRIAMQCSESDAALILADDNTAARLLSRPGEAIYNDASGLIEGNHPFQVAWLEPNEHESMLKDISLRDAAFGDALGPPIIFEGNRPSRFTAKLAQQAIQSASSSDTLVGLLGEAVQLGPPTKLSLQKDNGRNAMLVAPAQQRVGVVTSIIASVLAFRRDCALRLIDGSRADDGPSVNDWLRSELIAGIEELPSIRTIRNRDAETAMLDLVSIVSGRLALEKGESSEPANEPSQAAPDPFQATFSLDQPDQPGLSRPQPMAPPSTQDGSHVPEYRAEDDKGEPILVVVDSLDRIRDLRQDESMDFTLDASSAMTGSKAFQTVLRDGPSVGVFVLVTMASAETLSRWLPRKSHRDLELRMLGPINAADSALLIDSPAASDLSPATMILYDDADGRTLKFRLCDPPSKLELQELLATENQAAS